MTPQELEALLDANAAALALPIAAEHRPGVLHYLALAASYAELVQAQHFGIADDPAAVFVPVEPPGPDAPRSGESAASAVPVAGHGGGGDSGSSAP